MLPKTFRFTAHNALGVTLSIGAVVIKAEFWKRNTDGTIIWSSESTVFSNDSTIASGTGTAEDTFDNSTSKYEGGTFSVTVIAPTSSSGSVTIYFDPSTDSGTTYPDLAQSYPIRSIAFTSSGTKKVGFFL